LSIDDTPLSWEKAGDLFSSPGQLTSEFEDDVWDLESVTTKSKFRALYDYLISNIQWPAVILEFKTDGRTMRHKPSYLHDNQHSPCTIFRMATGMEVCEHTFLQIPLIDKIRCQVK